MRIRHLPETLINRIAAGEVIERPAAVIKELVENSIDAGARRIEVEISDGGRSFMSVTDDGHGMGREDLEAALDRHATSKLPDEDLLNITHLGFRGEALPSIASVSRMRIASHLTGATEAWEISCEGGKKSQVKPSSQAEGTRIEVRDLFYATPARLKFLKTERSEAQAVRDIVQRLAMAAPEVAFRLTINDKAVLTLAPASRAERLAALMGREFGANAMEILAERESIQISGLAGLPTLHKGNGLSQYLFVNGRSVRDRLLLGAIKGAYGDTMARDRYPMATLFITLPAEEVDVNVHPAKAEVRFRDSAHVRGLMVSALRQAIYAQAHQASNSVSYQALSKMAETPPMPSYSPSSLPLSRGARPAVPSSYSYRPAAGLAERSVHVYAPQFDVAPSARHEPVREEVARGEAEYPLGAARAQIHENYIIAQSARGMVIIDQHAAHERLVYEKLKLQQNDRAVLKQGLLTPEIVELGDAAAQNLLAEAACLAAAGLEIEAFGAGAIAVQSIPAVLGDKANIVQLMNDLSDELEEHGTVEGLQDRILAVLSRAACHGSVRSGRRMSAEEMNHLLRQMEATPLSGQCNHGRPTYIELGLEEIEKLFRRR